MPRAKRTARADARRRARVTAAADVAGSDDESGRSPAPAKGSATAPAARPSVLGAFREAYQPVHLRDDIRALPWLVTRTPAIWLPTLLIVATSIWYLVSGGSVVEIATSRYGSLAGIAFSLLVAPPPFGSAFLAGILAPRMAYLAGLIAGVVSLLAFALVVAIAQPGLVTNLPPGLRESWILWALTIGPISGLAVGAFAGFYRRFLRRANPNAGARRQESKAKPAKAPARR